MSKSNLLIVIGICLSALAFAQSHYGIKAGIGASDAGYNLQAGLGKNPGALKPSTQLGFFYQNTFKSNFVIGAEINFNRFEPNTNNLNDLWIKSPLAQGSDLSDIRDAVRRKSTNIQPTFNFGYSFGNFTGTAGLGINCNAFSHRYYECGNESAGQNYPGYRCFSYNMPSASSFTYGIRLGGGYMLNNKMCLGVSYSKYCGCKSNQFLAEMRYYIR